MEGRAPDPDERFAEWYVWAKREVATDPKVCLGAAQAGLAAEQAGAAESDARRAARRSTGGLGVGFTSEVPARRRAYAEWYDWARREVRGGPAQQHAATRAAMASLDAGGNAVEAASRGRQAADAHEAANTPAPDTTNASMGGPPPPLPPPPAPPATSSAAEPPLTSIAPRTTYAGFWRRAVALLIDSVLLLIGWLIGAAVILFFLLISVNMGGQAITDASFNGILLALIAGGLVLFWLYFAGLECSPWQGTVGKRVMRIMVTDEAGSRIPFGRATGRYFAKIISAIPILAGFWLVPVLGHKQGIHDLIAGTLVVKREHLALVRAQAPPAQPAPSGTSGHVPQRVGEG